MAEMRLLSAAVKHHWTSVQIQSESSWFQSNFAAFISLAKLRARLLCLSAKHSCSSLILLHRKSSFVRKDSMFMFVDAWFGFVPDSEETLTANS